MALGGSDFSASFAGQGSLGGAAGDLLGQQLEGETEEMKRRKLLLQQMQEAVSPMGAANVLGLPGGGGGGRAAFRSMFGGLRASQGY